MVLNGNVTVLQMPGNEYTSCIKINGIPILPPLITSERRLELQNCKKRAVELERRLKCQKDLKLFIEQLDSNNSKLGAKEAFKNNSHMYNRTLEHLLCFDSDVSHIDALNIPDISKKSNEKLPLKDCKTLVPLKEQKPTNLSCNIFDVTEYSDNGVVIFNEYNKSEHEQIDKLSASTVELDLTEASGADEAYSDILPGAVTLQGNECIKNLKSNFNTLNSKKSSPEDKNKNFSTSTLTTEINQKSKPKPRLLRSNSYTLESPSPVLLEHFKKQAEQDPNSSYAFENYSGPKRRSLDLGNSSHSSISIDDFACKTSDCRSLKSPLEYKKKFSSPQREEHFNDNTLKGCDFISVESVGQVVQDLAQKHFGTSNKLPLPKKGEVQDTCNAVVTLDNDNDKKADNSPSLNSRVEQAEAALQEVLSTMPENYAKDIVELLERHKKEQEMKLKSYAAFKQQLFDQNVNLNGLARSNTSDLSATKNIEKEMLVKDQEMKVKSYETFEQQLLDQNVNLNNLARDNTTSDLSAMKNIEENTQFDPLSPSPRNNTVEKQSSMATSGCEEIKSFSCDSQAVVSLVSSPTDTLNALNTSTPLLIDFESDSCCNEPLTHFEHNSSYSNSDPLHVLRGYDDYRCLASNLQQSKSPNCSRELFPEKPDKTQRKLREQWAATILTAAARGYLVRRLKRTERVRNLIQTIQDALLCAMSLHTENSDSIHPPDVELHRRLIQQVSAACYEFYEVFFNLTTKDQMALIALDRQRLQEKLKRPKSTSSLKLDSSRSTPKSQRQSFNNMRQKKILTPSFAA